MRRLLLAITVFLIVGILLSLVFHEHQGYVLISFNGWQIETSVLFALAGVLLGLWVLVSAWRLLVALLFAPRTWRRLRNRRRRKKARHARQSGLLHLAEARWASAEGELTSLAESRESPGLNYLFAARAAHYQDHGGDRDEYLGLAGNDKDMTELAVLMTRAELEIAAGEQQAAMETLARLYALEPRHPWVLRLYSEQALATEDHGVLHRLLPHLKQAAGLTESRRHLMAVVACRYLLSEPAAVGDLTAAWGDVPKEFHRDPAIANHYARSLMQLGEHDEAANVIRGILKKTYDSALVLTYGELAPLDDSAQLVAVEQWIDKHGEQPALMLTAGRLCLARELWGRAQHYLAAAGANQAGPSAWFELGRLQERLNETDDARQSYRRGLEIVARS